VLSLVLVKDDVAARAFKPKPNPCEMNRVSDRGWQGSLGEDDPLVPGN